MRAQVYTGQTAALAMRGVAVANVHTELMAALVMRRVATADVYTARVVRDEA